MKKIISLTLLFLACWTVHAQWVVSDPSLLAQTLINTYVARDQLDTARNVVSRLGDAASLSQVPGASAVLQSFGGTATAGAGDAAAVCTGKGALNYDGNKVYPVLGETIATPDGTTVERQIEAYRKFDAAHQRAAQYRSVMRDTESRRDALLAGIKSTTEAIQKAENLAEVQKLQAVASTQVAALSAIEGERTAALGAVIVQSLDNTTDDAQQAQGRAEERSLDFQTASSRFVRFLTPMPSRVTIPGTRGDVR